MLLPKLQSSGLVASGIQGTGPIVKSIHIVLVSASETSTLTFQVDIVRSHSLAML